MLLSVQRSLAMNFFTASIGRVGHSHTHSDNVFRMFKRLKHKVNVQHPWPGTIERQILVAVTERITPDIKIDPAEKCTRRASIPDGRQALSEYEKFLVGHQKNVINNSVKGLLIFCYQMSCSTKVYWKNLILLRKNGFNMHRINRKVFRHAIKGTNYETLETVLGPSTVIITMDTTDLTTLTSVLKKIPELYVLCGVVEGRLLSKSQLEVCSTYPSKDILLSQLSATLNQLPQQTSQLLSTPQQELTNSLQLYSDENK